MENVELAPLDSPAGHKWRQQSFISIASYIARNIKTLLRRGYVSQDSTPVCLIVQECKRPPTRSSSVEVTTGGAGLWLGASGFGVVF